MLELQVLLRQADELCDRLGKHFPESVGITLAQALEVVGSGWWADRYWAIAAGTDDPYFRVYTLSYWANALWGREQYATAWAKMEEVAITLTAQDQDARIVRGDNYLNMGQLVAGIPYDPDRPAAHWFDLARKEYVGLPAGLSNDRLGRLKRAWPDLPARDGTDRAQDEDPAPGP